MKDSLNQYQLRKLAIELRHFTVTELASATEMKREDVQAFLHRLEKQNSRNLTKQSLPPRGPGRPLVRYSVTPKGVEFLASKIAPFARILNDAALQEDPSPVPVVAKPAEARPPWGQRVKEWWRMFEPDFSSAIEAGASALFLKPGEAASIRVAEGVKELPQGVVWTSAKLEDAIRHTLTQWQMDRLRLRGLATCACPMEARNHWALRVQLAGREPLMELRKLPTEVPTVEKLHLSPLVAGFAHQKSGLVLITGIGRSGRSGILAALIDRINRSRLDRVITLEEPALYVHEKALAFLEQRQISVDVPAFAPALDQALEDEAEVLALTDLDDPETVSMVLAAAERCLIFCRITATHSEDAIRKITNFFPNSEQMKIRAQLTSNLTGIIAVTGVESAAGAGLFPATAAVRVEGEVRKILEDPAQSYLLSNCFEVDSPSTHSLKSSIIELRKQEIITESVAERYLARPATAVSEAVIDNISDRLAAY